MSTIYLSGGIGNQLFQVGFGHYLNLKLGEQIVLKKPKLRSGLPHTHLSFFEKNFNCMHCVYKIHQGNVYVNELINPWNSRVKSLSRRSTLDCRAKPFISPFEIKNPEKYDKFLGYFQNLAFIKPAESILLDEIHEVLSKRTDIESKIGLLENTEVIHVRQGDTNSINNKKRVGILSSTFYRRLIGKRKSFQRRLVVTDDIEGAREVLREIKVDHIYGTDELDPWETLSLMAKSKRLITANSTLSWWGGFLALANGAEVIIPKPFFINPELETDGVLKYPGFSEFKSEFVE